MGTPSCLGFQHAEWHDSCVQKCIIPGKLCAVILSVTSEIAVKICSDHLGADHQKYSTAEQMERVSRFCIYLLDKIIIQNGFSWKDTMVVQLVICLLKLILSYRLYSHVVLFCSVVLEALFSSKPSFAYGGTVYHVQQCIP